MLLHLQNQHLKSLTRHSHGRQLNALSQAESKHTHVSDTNKRKNEPRYITVIKPYQCRTLWLARPSILGKSAGADKKLFKQLESKYSFDIANSSFSPEDRQLNNLVSPFGPLDQAASRKTLFYLLATLNAAFPDYDFSEVRPEQFSKQISTQLVINSVNTTLFNLGNDVIVNRYR